ncbi:MAG: hypothetical protein A2W25_14000 [candidate division Zixibacteria bacterium RBG_16_53_22]|nr:MAG: hypothetical protein A2W25_14000 [candidate division Zixibacteria bacterium RBG_16_53_22]
MRSTLMALAVLLLLFSVAEIKRAEAYYYPPYNIPPGPPPNYSEIDTSYFLGAPVLPDPPPDSGGFYIWVDSTGAWNIANHLFVRGNNIEQYHGSILALMSSPPAPGVNVFATNFELISSGSPSGCYRQNDRWGWYQWDENLYEIWWDVSTRESNGDENDFMKVRVVGCAIDFNLWCSGHDHGFSAADVYLGESTTRLLDISEYYDSYPGISDPYDYQHDQSRNISFFNELAGSGQSYNKCGQINPGQTYSCDPIEGQLYGDRFAGAFAYEGNGLQFSATCTHDPCQDNTAPELQGPFAYSTFQCSPTQYCFDINYFDNEGNFHHFELLSGPGTIDSLTGLLCFIPDGDIGDFHFTVAAIDECGKADTAEYGVGIVYNSPPVAITPLNQIIQTCNLGQICIPGFTASDPDDNLVSKTLVGGTLHGDTACFTPVAGANTLKLIATDACGVTDTSITIVTVDLNRPPVAVTPSNQNMFVCNLNQVCLPGFSASDPDGNLASTILIGGTLQGDDACFTPVVGPNTLTLIATDACGAADTSVTVVTVGLNRPPVAIAPADQNMFVCNLSQICIPGFISSDPDGNIVSRVIQGGSLHGDTACFVPAPGPNTIRLIVTDACGLADTAQTVVTIAVNQPPVAVTPSNQDMFVCSLDQVCLPGFSASDPDGNLASTILIGGTLQGNNACFTPVVGPNTLTLIATDACGAADTSATVVTVTLNQAPVAIVHVDTSYFLCAIGQICLPGFSASDADGNISTVTLVGGTLSGDTACFTPAAGINTIKLIVTDVCGAADTGVASITVTLNSPPIASGPADTSLVRPDLSTICLPGFTATDPDGNLVSRVILGGTLNGDTACFTPVQGLNILTLICTDACGAADTSVTEVTVNLVISLSIAGAPPVFFEEMADSFLIAVSGGNPGSLAFVTDFTAHAGAPSRFATSYSNPNFKTAITFDYLGEFSSAQSPFAYRVIASDGNSADTLDLSLVVSDNNRVPTITSINDTTILVGSTLAFAVTGNDLDTDNTLTLAKFSGPGNFTSAPGPPPVTGNFNWSPVTGNIGANQVIFSVDDGRGGLAADTVNIFVRPTGILMTVIGGAPPVFTEEIPDSFFVALGGFDPGSLGFATSFPGHSGTPVRYLASLVGGNIRATATFDFLGEFSNADSPFAYRIIAWDNFSADTLDLSLVVNDNNRPPEITAGSNYTVIVDHPLNFMVSANDIDTDNILTLVKASGPGSFAGASGPPPVSNIFSWTPTDVDLPGSPYTVKFAADDGRGGVDTAMVTITVFPEGAPTIGLVYSPSTFYEGRLDSIVFTASDPEGDALGGFGYKFLSPESTFTGASFAVRNDTAYLRLTFNYVGNWSSTGSPFPLRLMGYSLITDADSAYLNIAVSVVNTNRKPELTVTGPNSVVAGDNVTLNVAANDLDTDDILTLTASGLPSGSNFSDLGDGNGQFTWVTNLPDIGNYAFRFFADDNRGQTNSRDTVLWNLQVTPPDTGEIPVVYGLDIPGAIDTILHELDCRLVLPGANIMVPVTYHIPDPAPGPDISAAYTGGFELLLRWDPLALTYTGATPAARINDGSEYFNEIPSPEGPGTVRLVWVADINNGIHTRPALPDLDADFSNPFVYLNFHVASDLPFGVSIPIEFMYTGDFTDNTISDSTGYTLFAPPHDNGCLTICDPALFSGDPNMNCLYYEIADAVLVAQRLIQGTTAWDGDNTDFAYDPSFNCDGNDFHSSAFDDVQEAAADLNDNGFADVGDLVWFINILNGIAFPPKLDPVTGTVGISLNDGVATINSGVEIGAALVTVVGEISHINAGDMDVMTHAADGMTSVLIYSLASARIPAGTNTLFTCTGEGAIVEVSAADAYGRLLDISARPAAQLPTETGLGQNYPNPFNPSTAFRLALAEAGEVQLVIYDIAGRKVQTLVSSRLEAGFYDIVWNGRNAGGEDVASGIYFARLVAGSRTESVKMSLIR